MATVHVVRTRWAGVGDAVSAVGGRGGRRHQHLTQAHEKALFMPFFERALAGGMLRAAVVRQAHQEQSGNAVACSTVYRLLERHGWRQVVSLPRRPGVGARPQRKHLCVFSAFGAFSAVSPRVGLKDCFVLPWVDTQKMSMCLDAVAKYHADEFACMVMDQTGWRCPLSAQQCQNAPFSARHERRLLGGTGAN